MSNPTDASLAVWDVPLPVVAGEQFSVKVGATSATGNALTGSRVEVSHGSGATVASGVLGSSPWPGTEALHWVALDVPAPAAPCVAEYTVRLVAHGGTAATTRFSVAVAGRPQHTLIVTVTEQNTAEALSDVEIRLGPFHARTDQYGRAQIRLCRGDYRLELWRTAHIAPPQPISIAGDTTIALTMVHVPEEHPDARWVR